jgi:nitroreductase
MQLRKLIRLPESEVVIMIIAVGHIPEKLMVARSARKPLEEVLFFEG